MKRAVCIILAITLLFAMTSGCSFKGTAGLITEVKVMLPCSAGVRSTVEGEAVIATQLYLLSRAYSEKLETYRMDDFNAREFSSLLAETAEAYRVTEEFCKSFERHADALAAMEEAGLTQQGEASFELLSAPAGSTGYSPFSTSAYAAEEKSPAVKYAEEITKAFDQAKNGQKLKAVAQQYGTDIKKAKAMLEQAQAILEGAAYEDQAAFENKCYEAAVETKAAASAIGFGVALAASGGIAAGGATAAGIIEAGGLAFSGVSAIVDLGTAVTIHTSCGEGNEYTAAWEKTSEVIAPVATVFAIGGGIQNIVDFRNPEKAADAVNNAAQAFLTGMGIVRDYVQDGTVLGVSTNIIDGYREIIVRSAAPADRKAAKEVLLKTGISEDDLNDSEKNNTGEVLSPEQMQNNHPGLESYVYIGVAGAITDTENPVNIGAFLKNVDEAFRRKAANEGMEIEDITQPVAEPAPESIPESNSYSLTDPVSEFSAEIIESEPMDSENEIPSFNSILSAADIAGSYYFPELEDSARICFTVSDNSHLIMTDVDNGESFVGDYDEATGVFHSVLSDRFQWYVTVTFRYTGYGIQAVLEEGLGGMHVTSSALKE